jgi:hypothetical protein
MKAQATRELLLAGANTSVWAFVCAGALLAFNGFASAAHLDSAVAINASARARCGVNTAASHPDLDRQLGLLSLPCA